MGLKSAVTAVWAVAVLASVAGCGGGGQAALPRLRAEGTAIVDEAGHEVMLRGVNLGGWMFHETWITLVGQTTAGVALQLAEEQGILDIVRASIVETGPDYGTDRAVVKVCPANGEEWIGRWQPNLTKAFLEAGLETSTFLQQVRAIPAICDDADLQLRSLLSERFGDDGRDELLGIFQDAWIAEADIAWLAGQGFNLVRVPVTYRSLVHGPDVMRPTGLDWNEAALARLDHLFDWCAKHGVYAVLDIQEAPGAQNPYAGESLLYGDPALEALTVELWTTLSDRYRDRNEVAAYSLLAEPYGAPNATERDRVYDLIVKAIRARGDDHLLVIHDGFFGMGSLPTPADYGWTGVVYSTHLFEWAATSYDDIEFSVDRLYEPIFTQAQARQGVPYYIGSFATFLDVEWAYRAAGHFVDWFEGHGWSWSSWTYKRIDDPVAAGLFGYTTSWGLRGRLNGSFDRPDPVADDFETLKRKLAGYADLGLGVNQDLYDAMTGPWKAAE